MTTLIPILGDQLSPDISSLRGADPAGCVLLMMEVAAEARYVRHHRRKLAYVLSAMRHHALALRRAGWTVDYVRLDDPDNTGSFTGEVERAAKRHKAKRIVVTEAGEWRVKEMLDGWGALLGVPVEVREDGRFVASHEDFRRWADTRPDLVMEFFYRDQRRRTGLLMDGDEPEGGRWNYDPENRRPGRRDLFTPRPPRFPADRVTRDVIELVRERFPDLQGSLNDWDLAVTRADAERARDWFLDHALAGFGAYQDAMVTGEPLLWHGRLSGYINSGLLDPLELCRQVEARYRAGCAPLNSAEGFIRQIIGWREYMRGTYWRAGPVYIEQNYLRAERPLPAFYWTGATHMNCLAQTVQQTWALSYAHHIQRLMILGNFAMLIGADPKTVHAWYMEVYFDAYEWVTLPNVVGMSQYGDGGLLGSKPYAASGAYIDRMSDYCQGCRYDPAERVGDRACPFNALYWDFLDRHRTKEAVGGNPRLAPAYLNWDRKQASEREVIRARAATLLARLDGAAEADKASTA